MPKIPDSKIEEIRTAIDIVPYIGQFINLKKSGQNYKGLCPFHTEKTPSFIVSPEKQIFHCFGCGKGGNLFTFMMDYEKLNFMEAVQKAADFAGIRLPRYEKDDSKTDYYQMLYTINEQAADFFVTNLLKADHRSGLQYVLDRRISEKTIKTFKLGYAPDAKEKLVNYLKKAQINLTDAQTLGLIQTREQGTGYIDNFRHRVMFTFFNISGKIIGFGGRKLREEQQPKYLNSPESVIYKKGEILYGLHQAIYAIREKEYVLLVEGYFDLLRLFENNIKNVVAGSGTALTSEQVKLLRRYTSSVYLSYDGDEAGIKAASRNAQILEKEDLNVSILEMPEEHDPDSFILSYGVKRFEDLIATRLNPVQFQINQFYKINSNPNLEQKEKFTYQLIENLSELKNQIKIGLYLQQISERLQINESLLIAQLNRLKKNKSKYLNTAVSQVGQQTRITRGEYAAEAGIIGLLLTMNPEIRNYINEHITADLFENKTLLDLYEHMMQEIEEKGQISIERLLSYYHDNERIKSILSEIALTLDLQSMRYAIDCIFKLKKWNLEKKSRELSDMIKNESGSQDSVLHYSQELMKIRRELNHLEMERRNQLKREM